MKRAFKIILVILFIAAIVLLVLWLLARRNAVHNGTPEPTFKEFFTRGSVVNQNPGQATPGENGGDFGNGSGIGDEDGTGSNGGSNGSIGGAIGGAFTNDIINPTGIADGGTWGSGGTSWGSDGSGSGIGTGTGDGTIPGSDGSGGIITGGPGTGGIGGTSTTPINAPTTILPSLASCTEADTHIEFTAAELAQLDTLSRQFYALAPALHSDADVASAQSAYDSFALQLSQIKELTTYAEMQTPKITDPQLRRRVATPFWTEADMVATFFPGDPDIETKHCGGEHCSVAVYYADNEDENMNKEEVQLARALLERYLRPSLW